MITNRLLVSDRLSDAGLKLLQETSTIEVEMKTGLSENELLEIIGNYEALIVRSQTKVTEKIITAATNLRVIGRAGIGVDNIDLQAASKKGITVLNTPLGNTVTTAEHALSLLSSSARHIHQATSSIKNGKWEKSKFTGTELWNKQLGIVGFGNIGKIVADRARGLKMNIIVTDPAITEDEAKKTGVLLASLDELLEKADFITIHAPLNKHTKHLFNDAAFKKMKKNAFIINAARGGIIDEKALAAALESNTIAGAALDVFEQEPPDPNHPLFKLDNCILTPHLGASTHEAQERVGVQIAKQVIAYLKDGSVEHGVNTPSLTSENHERLSDQIELAHRLGKLIAQLCEEPDELRVSVSGSIADLSKPLAQEALAGFLEKRLGQHISTLSAPYEAKEQNIKLKTMSEPENPIPTIRVTVSDKQGIHTATGRRSRAGALRLVALEGYPMDAALEGHVLILKNKDKPGVIGAVGTLMGRYSVNVSRLQVGLDEKCHDALALWNLDSEPPENLILEIKKIEHINSVQCVAI